MAASLECLERHALVEAMFDQRSGADVCTSLTDLLDERAAIYRGLDRNAADRLRGYVLSRFADVGLPDSALPFVREELETGDSTYCMAAAARALAGTNHKPVWAAAALQSAVERVLYTNDSVGFTAHASAQTADTTVLAELFLALGRLGASARDVLPRLQKLAVMTPRPFGGTTAGALQAAMTRIEVSAVPHSCCGASTPVQSNAADPATRTLDTDALRALRVEDATGQQGALSRYVNGELNVVAFFYTRCMNPAKCSATIEKLVALQNRLGSLAGSCRLAAITYDPLYDTSPRLAAYGLNRGIGPGSAIHLLRCLDGIEPLVAHFDLGVGFGETTVNRHRSEVFVLDRHSRVVMELLRRQFDVDEALAIIQQRLLGLPESDPA